MKNKFLRISLLLTLCFLLCFSLFSCKDKAPISVSFVWNNGSEPTVVEVAEGEIPSVPEVPAYFGYVFAGWYSDAALTTPVTPGSVSVTADVSYYAAWTADTALRISFNAKGGSAVAPQTVKHGEKIDASLITAPVKEGYTFAGWYKNDACTAPYNFDVIPTENMTLYAGWTLNAGMGECIGIVGGREVARVAFPAGAPVLPETDDGVSYVWFTDPAYATPFSAAEVSASVKLYGIAYTDGLVISGNTVTGYNGSVRNVVVPELWNGVKITAIAANAFAGNTQIKSVTLPEDVESIGASAFYGCESLASVNLTSVCRTVGAYAFYGCKKLETAGDISGVNVIGDATFLGCTRLGDLKFSEGLSSVGKYAFSDCASVSAFDLPDTVITIGEYAFSGCTAVTEFHIPRGLVTFGTGALNGCASLAKLTYSDNNDTASYRVIDGNLYEGGKKLVLYVQGDKTETSFTHIFSMLQGIGA